LSRLSVDAPTARGNGSRREREMRFEEILSAVEEASKTIRTTTILNVNGGR